MFIPPLCIASSLTLIVNVITLLFFIFKSLMLTFEFTKILSSVTPFESILNDFNNDLDLEKNEALNYFITKKAKNKIIIILSNNINNLMNVDKLAVIDKGKLVGLGKHKELIKTCKEYQKIINE